MNQWRVWRDDDTLLKQTTCRVAGWGFENSLSLVSLPQLELSLISVANFLDALGLGGAALLWDPRARLAFREHTWDCICSQTLRNRLIFPKNQDTNTYKIRDKFVLKWNCNLVPFLDLRKMSRRHEDLKLIGICPKMTLILLHFGQMPNAKVLLKFNKLENNVNENKGKKNNLLFLTT